MTHKSLLEIAREIRFQYAGTRINYEEVKREYGLSENELNYVISLIRDLNKK